jgi:hypothetical protein
MPKSQEVESFLSRFSKATFDRERSFEECVSCGSRNLIFRDKLSKQEYGISRLCQTCQDDIFGSLPTIDMED